MSADRRALLASFGFSTSLVDRLLPALARELPPLCPDPAQVSLGNELFVPDWIGACVAAHQKGSVPALQDVIFELNFPIAGGISGSAEYQNLALAGSQSLADVRGRINLTGPAWEAPDALRLFMHDTGAGLLPVVHAAARADFVTLVRAIVHKNEPAAIPGSMGSSFINGYNNRSRYLRVREALACGALTAEMRNPQLWKDKLLLLTSGPYSGVSAARMALDHAVWIDRSTAIRLDHESCHYAIRRLFPRLKFGLQDELVADFAGLFGATGSFRAADFLLFMGLEDFPTYRPGGRFENYHKELTADPEAASAVARLLVDAARNLETFFTGWDLLRYDVARLRLLATLTHLPLEALAAPSAPGVLAAALGEKA